ELLRGEHAFDGPEVRKVFDVWREAVPYFDPNGSGYSFDQALTPLWQKKAGMYLIGAFFQPPADAADDVDFFSFPTIDSSCPRAEEAPVDGYFAAANGTNP